jgi:hypothetical protein
LTRGNTATACTGELLITEGLIPKALLINEPITVIVLSVTALSEQRSTATTGVAEPLVDHAITVVI